MKHIIGFFISFLLLLPSVAFPEIKEIISEGTYNMGDGETPTVAESRALLEAKRVAVEQAGTYIESYSKVKSFQLTHDEIQVLASGVMEVTILDKKRTVVGDGINFWVKIKAKVSTDKIDVMANRVKEKMIVQDYKRIQKDYEKSQKEIADLKKQLREAKSEGEKKQVVAKITDEERLFQANTWLEKADNYHLNKEYDNAIEAYTRAIVLDPNNDYLYIMRGATYSQKSQLDKALEDLNRGIALVPPLDNWSDVASRQNTDKRGVIYDPFSPDLTKHVLYSYDYSIRGYVYFQKGQYERAIGDYNRSIALYPNQSDVYHFRGLAYELKGQLDKAFEDYSCANYQIVRPEKG